MKKNDEDHYNEWETFQLESDEVREIILLYMTMKCDKKIIDNHLLECTNYHVDGLNRRKPFFEGKLLYASDLCIENEKGICNLIDKCKKSHNNFEVMFHPSKYRTYACDQKHLLNYKFCPYAHSKDQLRNGKFYERCFVNSNNFNVNSTYSSHHSDISFENNMERIQNSNRQNFYDDKIEFDLISFKTLACLNSSRHNEKQCLFYHSNKDRRRLLSSIQYSSEICLYSEDDKECPNKDFCSRSHNRVEQFYHPEKFKSKYCSHFGDNLKLCPYGNYCSFAHSEEGISVQLIHKITRSQDFYLFYFKTVWCPFNNQHDKSSCIYAHNWQDFRRSVVEHNYTENLCSQWDIKKTILNYSNGCKNEYR